MIVPSIASRRLRCPSTMLCQVGALASSKSAMNPSAPEFSALIVILRSVGPVISTQRCCMSGGDRRHGPVALADLARVGQEVEHLPRRPAARAGARAPRAARSRRGPNRRWSSATNSSASGVSTSSKPGSMAPCSSSLAWWSSGHPLIRVELPRAGRITPGAPSRPRPRTARRAAPPPRPPHPGGKPPPTAYSTSSATATASFSYSTAPTIRSENAAWPTRYSATPPHSASRAGSGSGDVTESRVRTLTPTAK